MMNKTKSDESRTYRFLHLLAVRIKKPSTFFILSTFCFIFWLNDFHKPFNTYNRQTNFLWDGAGYYSYLPAVFHFKNFDFEGYSPLNKEGRHYPKYTYGVALLELPFFAIGYTIAYFEGDTLDGFSPPFAESVRLGNIFYILLGTFFLRKFLLNFFSELVTGITLFSCLFGTMLYMYAFIQTEISHGYLYSLFCIFIYLTHKWHKTPNHKNSILIAITLALISIVRFPEIYIFLFFAFWNVKSIADLKVKFAFFLKNFKFLLWFPFIAFIFWIPQMCAWKYSLGSYIINPYNGERFFWDDPQIMNILFSYRKGWFVYTPLAVFSIIGILFIKKDFPFSRLILFLIVSLMTYVYSCWWDWGYGGCFGNRAFCQMIALLSIPIASLVKTILYLNTRSLLKELATGALFVVLFSCAFLNIGQSYQFQQQGILHFSEMSEEIYWRIFGKYNYGYFELNNYQQLLRPAPHVAWSKGLIRDDIHVKNQVSKQNGK